MSRQEQYDAFDKAARNLLEMGEHGLDLIFDLNNVIDQYNDDVEAELQRAEDNRLSA